MLQRAFFTLFLFAALDVPRAAACSCAGPLAPCAQAWRVDAVFAGRVLDIRPSDNPGGSQAVRIAVEQRGRGVDADIVEVHSTPQNGVNCGYTFQAGERYVVYASRSASGLTTNMCSGTKRAADASGDLAYLKELAGPPQGVRIFGAVHRVEQDLVTGTTRDFGPVADAVVTLAGERESRTATTGADGTIDVRGLPPGPYTVTMSFPRGLALLGPPLPPQEHQRSTFTVSLPNPLQCAELQIQPHTDSQITGVLLTSDGRPADNEPVVLIAQENGGRTSPRVPHRRIRTGRDGCFTFAFIPPGRYLVGSGLDVPPPPSQLDRRSYHPGVTAAADATVVTIEAGSRVALTPHALPEWPVTRVITGRVMWSDGVPAPDATLTITGATREPVVLDQEGRFTLTLPYGALFSLHASASPSVNGRRMSARIPYQEIGRNQRDGPITVVLKVPQ